MTVSLGAELSSLTAQQFDVCHVNSVIEIYVNVVVCCYKLIVIDQI